MNGIEYKPMAQDFVLSLCPQVLLKGPIDRDDPDAFRGALSDCPQLNLGFFKHQLDENGTCAILAWDGHLLVGAVLFLPSREISASIGKVYGVDFYPEEWWKKLDAGFSTLVVTCLTVAKGYRGMGIARGMAESMIGWTRAQRRWATLLVPGVQTEVVGYNQRAALPFWERLGFKIRRVNDRASQQPTWAARMKTELMRKQEMGSFAIEGIDFSLLLRQMGWNGLLASYDMEMKLR